MNWYQRFKLAGMNIYPSASSQEVERVLRNLGFEEVGVNGSHHRWRHRDFPLVRCQSVRSGTVDKGLMENVFKKALGFKPRDVIPLFNDKGKGWTAPAVEQAMNAQKPATPVVPEKKAVPQIFDPNGDEAWKNWDPRYNREKSPNKQLGQAM